LLTAEVKNLIAGAYLFLRQWHCKAVTPRACSAFGVGPGARFWATRVCVMGHTCCHPPGSSPESCGMCFVL